MSHAPVHVRVVLCTVLCNAALKIILKLSVKHNISQIILLNNVFGTMGETCNVLHNL